MIIKARKKSGLGSFNWAYLLLPALLCVFWFYPKSTSYDQRATDLYVVCDAEEVVKGNFIFKDYVIGNGITQSDEESYSGKYSSKTNDDHQYGMSLVIPVSGRGRGLRYVASIRRLTSKPSESALAVSGNGTKNFQMQTSEAIDKDNDGWELLRLEFYVPNDNDLTELKVFPYSFGQGSAAYFDDLKIESIELNNLDAKPLPKLHVYLDQKAVTKLEAKRSEALKKGILKTGDNDWVKAKLTIDDEEAPVEVKLRLKGDWTDHLQGDYWSYRVQMPADRSWNRLQTFSLQDPKTRYYLHEWLYHKALEQEDILTPRYGFVLLRENAKRQVLYAYEEHFDKQIAEYKERREGVIVKFEEDFFWDQRIRSINVFDNNGFRNALSSAEVLPFKAGKTTKSPKLLEQLEQARSLMNAFRNRSAPVSEVFDVERLAKYFALTDVFDAQHGSVWHNLRFYYNPITRKLEPIGFDGFTELGALKKYENIFFGEYKSSADGPAWEAIYHYIFRDKVFNEAYSAALLKYASSDYFSELEGKFREELYGLEKQIKAHIDPEYRFSISDLIKRSKRIRNDIIPFPQISIKVHKEFDNEGKPTFWATNNHSLPLEVFGGSRKNNGEVLIGETSLIRSNKRRSVQTYTEISLPKGSKYACFRLPGLDSVFYTEVYNWNRVSSELQIKYSSSGDPVIPLAEGAFSNVNKTITIRSGKHQISTPMVVPEGYTLIIEAGAEIDLRRKAYLLSYGSLFCLGTSEAPILFTSSDKSAQGVAVIQAKETSELSYTSFHNLNTLEENEWQLTGAVTFYESDVKFNMVTVSYNLCEDALNLVRCKFEISGLNINHTFADGFDGDFCRGTLNDSYLFKTGNDGLDFSGSWVKINNVTLDQIGDKGISAGEEAHLTVVGVNISNAQIGIASKDLSEVNVSEVILKDCNQGFAAYRKKPEFGGGTIIVNSYETENVNRISNADKESKITLP